MGDISIQFKHRKKSCWGTHHARTHGELFFFYLKLVSSFYYYLYYLLLPRKNCITIIFIRFFYFIFIVFNGCGCGGGGRAGSGCDVSEHVRFWLFGFFFLWVIFCST